MSTLKITLPIYPPVPITHTWVCLKCGQENKEHSTREELLQKTVYERKKCGKCKTDHFLAIGLKSIDRCLIT